MIRALAILPLILATPAAAETYRVPPDCVALAARYGVPDVLDRAGADRVVAQLDSYRLWPGVRRCRAAIKREWRL